MVIANIAIAYEPFEINKKNCNLPVQKIRKLVPDKSKRQKIYHQCMKKAAQERWLQKSLVSK
ncbi:MAG: hypothetical protein KGV50_00935 [Gammaproteobacteria bacterium]|nr:hypothetical protein [Gammaproteobacteria bacterium]